MGLLETEETNKFSFEAFAAHAFYTEINRSLVRRALAPLLTLSANQEITIIDMACGTGSVTRLIAEEMTRQKHQQVRIIGVDPSAEALRVARISMEAIEVKVELIQGETGDLAPLVQDANAAFFCNAIHLIADKLSAFQQMAAILAPGGVLASNTAFYDGTSLGETTRFTRLWIRRAVGWLRKEHPEVRLSRDTRTTPMQWLPPEEYISLLEQSGMSDIDATQERVTVTLDGIRDLGRYWLFIEGALPGAPLTIGAAALSSTIYEVGQELGMTEVPRKWLQIISVKR